MTNLLTKKKTVISLDRDNAEFFCNVQVIYNSVVPYFILHVMFKTMVIIMLI